MGNSCEGGSCHLSEQSAPSGSPSLSRVTVLSRSGVFVKEEVALPFLQSLVQSLCPSSPHWDTFLPVVSHGSGNESFQNSQRLQNPALQGGPAHCLWLQTWALRMLLGSLDSSPPWGCFSSTNTPFHQPLPELRLLCAEHSGHPALIMLHVNYCSRHLSLPQGPAHPEDTAPPQSLVHIVGWLNMLNKRRID